MNFAQAQAYLNSTVNEQRSRREPIRLERMRAFLRELGDPQTKYPTIQVGGTSGKGSTCTMLASILLASGKRTGLHTKPHIRSVTERARIDGAPVSEDRFAELLTEMLPAIDAVDREHSRPSYYETLLALALLHFAQAQVDVAVIEVGIGGKLDGTNVLVPRICAITNVGLDHTDVLGETIEEIAADKAGIAKPGVPLVCGVEQPVAREIVREACEKAGAPFIAVSDVTEVLDANAQPFSQSFRVRTDRAEYAVELPLLGSFQQRNAATAVAVCERLGDLTPEKEDVERGFATLSLNGRMEYFPSHPGVVFDIAHNPDKAHHLADALRETFPGRRIVFVIAIGESKDANEILLALTELQGSFIFTSFEAQGHTATRPQKLASIAESLGLWGRPIQDPVEALQIARRNAGADDIVVVTGSTFVVAQLRAWWMEHVAPSRS
ncbi:MAG TPA: folylpolyglutamate synthase/dihydrofolate synthase family protein [Candidatus Baltobacteraceae bacterium]|nr:folylpolyglutamate synthase/dihydrofolate synthase family protein [Candidatus Baltobacteraceae bacterium]